MKTTLSQHESVWPHRWAVALVCATFPLIWVGGMVTTYDAGMAVPDWPNTYGYNLFLYPWQTWIAGPFNLFIEHGHRLLGSLVGMLTIAFVASTWMTSSSTSRSTTTLRMLGLIALTGVLLQGGLGGLRVIENKVQLAQVHGCFGPAFFAFTVALAVVTSRHWRSVDQNRPSEEEAQRIARIERLAVATTFLAYCQIVAGSFLRHLPTGAQPGQFRLMLFFHLAMAAALVVHIILLATRTARTAGSTSWLRRPAFALVLFVLVQLALGAGTWITKYGWPSWLSQYEVAAGYTVSGVGETQALITTGHVATGSLILAVSLLVALRAARLARHGVIAVAQVGLLAEAAR